MNRPRLGSKTRRSRTKSPKKKRVYNNQKREVASEKSRTAIILALVDLLCENQGADVEIGAVAKRSGISQRTIFRFFKDKPALHQAVLEYIAQYLQDAEAILKTSTLPEFAKFVFGNFESAPRLTTAYVLSSFGREARTLMRKKLNQVLIARLIKDNALKMSSANRTKIEFLVSLVNARVWYEMKTDFGRTGEKTGAVVEWALETLTKDLLKED